MNEIRYFRIKFWFVKVWEDYVYIVILFDRYAWVLLGLSILVYWIVLLITVLINNTRCDVSRLLCVCFVSEYWSFILFLTSGIKSLGSWSIIWEENSILNCLMAEIILLYGRAEWKISQEKVVLNTSKILKQ